MLEIYKKVLRFTVASKFFRKLNCISPQVMQTLEKETPLLEVQSRVSIMNRNKGGIHLSGLTLPR